MPLTNRNTKTEFSKAQLNASISPIWPKERICRRTLTLLLDEKSYAKLLERARENCRKMGNKAPIEKVFASLPTAWSDRQPEDVLKPDPVLIGPGAYRSEYGGDMVLERGVVVGGYRFIPFSSYPGFHMIIEKPEKGKVVSKTVYPKIGKTLKIKDGEKAITISIYGRLESPLLEGVYIKVE